MASRKERLTSKLNRRLAKAESILVLVLITDLVVNSWLYPNPRWPEWLKTVVVMALAVGLFGPFLSFVSKQMDSSLVATRKVTTKIFFVPTLLIHLTILFALFVIFYWVRLATFPWK